MRLALTSGAYAFTTAASGTAGNTISFTQAMTLDASGNLGIGTSSPKEKIDSRGAAVFSGDNATGTNAYGTAAGILLSTSSDNTKARITAVSNGANSISLVLRSLSSGSAVDAVTVDSSGNLGLGVTPTNNTLGKSIQNGQASAWVSETGSNRFWLASNWKYDGSDKYLNNGFATLYSQQSGQHQWLTAASGTANTVISFTQAMTLDASGNLQLGGTTNKTTGVSGSGSGFTVQASGAPTVSIWDTTDTSYYTNFTQVNEVSYIWNIANGPMAFGTNNTERARFNATGAFVFAGGTTTANGIGITFPASQSASTNANTLDDYEEGTWTPTITGLDSNPSVTYSVQNGYYTKIGRQVSINGIVVLSALSGGSGRAFISGLPFSVSGDTQAFPIGVVGQMNNFTSAGGDADGQLIVIRGDNNNARISFMESNETTLYDWDISNLSATFVCRFNLVYFV
jgi:hypothetical protein